MVNTKKNVKGKNKEGEDSTEAAMLNMAQSVTSMAKMLKAPKPSCSTEPKSNVGLWAELLGKKAEKSACLIGQLYLHALTRN